MLLGTYGLGLDLSKTSPSYCGYSAANTPLYGDSQPDRVRPGLMSFDLT